jgi:hypothetical protein
VIQILAKLHKDWGPEEYKREFGPALCVVYVWCLKLLATIPFTSKTSKIILLRKTVLKRTTRIETCIGPLSQVFPEIIICLLVFATHIKEWHRICFVARCAANKWDGYYPVFSVVTSPHQGGSDYAPFKTGTSYIFLFSLSFLIYGLDFLFIQPNEIHSSRSSFNRHDSVRARCVHSTIRNIETGFVYKKWIVLSMIFFINYKPTHFLINMKRSDEARKLTGVHLPKPWVD